MGALLGLAAGLVLRGSVPYPMRWVSISALAWPPTRIVISLGATTPDESWPTLPVILLGVGVGVSLGTGTPAGAVFGLASDLLFDLLTGASIVNFVVLMMFRLRARRAIVRSMLGLRLRGRRTGRVIVLPVQFVAGPGG
jgi:hypothetical protein